MQQSQASKKYRANKAEFFRLQLQHVDSFDADSMVSLDRQKDKRRAKEAPAMLYESGTVLLGPVHANRAKVPFTKSETLFSHCHEESKCSTKASLNTTKPNGAIDWKRNHRLRDTKRKDTIGTFFSILSCLFCGNEAYKA